MTTAFNVDEIYEIAEEIKRQGAKFYREAAKHASDKKTKQMLLDMAAMEDNHLGALDVMRKQLHTQEIGEISYDPENEAALYLRTIADAHGWEGKKGPTEKLTGCEEIKDILEMAINSEKDSVAFYIALKNLVPVSAGRDQVELIITEELSHIRILLSHIKRLRQLDHFRCLIPK